MRWRADLFDAILIAMPVFAVIAASSPEKLKEHLDAYGAKAYRYASNVWLVAYDGTTRELAESLGIRKGETSAGLVLSVANYSGRANPDVWEWLKLHLKETA